MSIASGALLFADSNVLIEDLLLPASAASIVVDLVAQGVYRMATSELVIKDVENVILKKASHDPDSLDILIAEFHNMRKLANLVVVPDPTPDQVRVIYGEYISVMRHKADIPVLAAGLQAKPDVILSGNREHFNDAVSARCRIPIFSCSEFLQVLATDPG